MSKWNVIYHKRLNGIREELNAYIALRTPVEESFSMQMPSPNIFPTEKKKHSVQEKFFQCGKPQEASEYDFSEWSERHPKLDKILAEKEETFSKMLLRMIDEKGLKDSDVYKRANIDRRLFSKIRGDEEYVPSKKTAISFCLALRLGLEEAQKLLYTAGYTLSASSRFDLIIMYLIEKKEYNIHFANIVLDDYGEGTLSR